MRRGLLVVAGAWVLLLLTPGLAEAKSFAVERVAVDATLNADASMDVVEHITYRFAGTFHNGTRPIPRGDYDITDMKVSEGERPLPIDGAPYNLAWHFDATDEVRTFDIAYRVVGAAKVGPDVGELNWKWVGEDHPQVGMVIARLRTAATADVRAWGHGTSNGDVVITGGVVTFRAGNVATGDFVEGHVAVPTSAFTLAPAGGPRLPTILRDERRSVQADEHAAKRRRRVRTAFSFGAPVLALVGLAGSLAAWRRWGREPTAPDIGDYWHDVPDAPPAHVDAVLHFGKVRPIGFSSTVVDLAQRGFLEITEEREESGLLHREHTDYRFRLGGKPADATLLPFERAVLDRLFADGPETTQSDLIAAAKEHPHDARRFWEGFEADVKSGVRGTYIDTGQAGPMALNVLLGAALVAVGVGALAAKAWVGGVAIVAGLVVLAVTVTLRRRTVLGAQRNAEWRGLRHFLHDFSSLDEAPVASMAVWERYLVYAVALGVADELVRGLALKVPDVATNATFAPWYVGMGGDQRGLASIGGFAADFGVAAHSAFVPSSSSNSSGFGGGFSGGGGGGGGGGGIGAS